MGNDSSSTLRDRYDDDETTIDGTSVFSQDTRETGFSGISRDTGMSGLSSRMSSRVGSSRMYRSPSQSARGGMPIPFGGVLNHHLIDTLCGNNFFEDDDDDDDESRYGSRRRSDRGSSKKKRKDKRRNRNYSHDESYGSDQSNESTDREDRRSRSKKSSKKEKEKVNSPRSDDSYGSEDFDVKEEDNGKSGKTPSNETLELNGKSSISKEKESSFDSIGAQTKSSLAKPLASSFAKRCYFTKAGIGKNMQHYEGITLSGNTVLMLAGAMKLKGCPTICDEDLRRVEQTYPNQFSRLPDELLLSSGWRRISKYCHFSGKPIPDGVPFYHSRERCHPNGGYYFLLAAAIGMERPSDVEPLSLDMLIVLQTDFPTQCDQTPNKLIEDPYQWTLVTQFCFFSGGPINSDEDVFYRADFNGHSIYMLAFLSPNMTPEELYRLNDITGENALKSVAAVEEIETVYDLTERDFDDLKMYHLGPCRALPQHLLTQNAWEKVLPQHFLQCRENALARAFEYEVHAQEAIAKAGKMVGLSASREQSYESISKNLLSYDSNNDGNPSQAINDQYSPTRHDERDNQRHNSAPQSQQIGSYVDMHRISDTQGQLGGSLQKPEKRDNVVDIVQVQDNKQSPGSRHEVSPKPGTEDDEFDINGNYDDHPIELDIMLDNPTADSTSQKDERNMSDTVLDTDGTTVEEDTNDAIDHVNEFIDETKRNSSKEISQFDDPPNEEKHDSLMGRVNCDGHSEDVHPLVHEAAKVTDLITEQTAITAKDPVIDGIDDDPTITDIVESIEDKISGSNIDEESAERVNDSDHSAFELFYKGIEERNLEVTVQRSASPSVTLDSSNIHFGSEKVAEVAGSMERQLPITTKDSSVDEGVGLSESSEKILCSPPDSEYVTIKEFDPISPEKPSHEAVESKPFKSPIKDVSPQNNTNQEDNFVITSLAGYGFARQVSSTPLKHPSSPKHTSPQRISPSLEEKVSDHDTPTTEDTPHDESSPRVQVDHLANEDVPDDEYSPVVQVDSLGNEDEKTDVALPNPQFASPYGAKTGMMSPVSSSTAMRGARELLKKNRQERLALMTKRRPAPSNQTPPLERPATNENSDPTKAKAIFSRTRSRSVTPNKKRFQADSKNTSSPMQSLVPVSPSHRIIPKTPPSATRRASNKDIAFGSPKSDLSGSSSVWTEDADSTGKDTRRALILKMAKNRMRSKKEVVKSTQLDPVAIN